jgi:hypothetical protein
VRERRQEVELVDVAVREGAVVRDPSHGLEAQHHEDEEVALHVRRHDDGHGGGVVQDRGRVPVQELLQHLVGES